MPDKPVYLSGLRRLTDHLQLSEATGPSTRRPCPACCTTLSQAVPRGLLDQLLSEGKPAEGDPSATSEGDGEREDAPAAVPAGEAQAEPGASR